MKVQPEHFWSCLRGLTHDDLTFHEYPTSLILGVVGQERREWEILRPDLRDEVSKHHHIPRHHSPSETCTEDFVGKSKNRQERVSLLYFTLRTHTETFEEIINTSLVTLD